VRVTSTPEASGTVSGGNRSFAVVFEVCDIAHNQLTGAASLGQVGLKWQIGGFAPDPLMISAR
jgi:hypothetical protein